MHFGIRLHSKEFSQSTQGAECPRTGIRWWPLERVCLHPAVCRTTLMDHWEQAFHSLTTCKYSLRKITTDDQQLRAKPTELITDISMQRIIFTSFTLSNNKADISWEWREAKTSLIYRPSVYLLSRRKWEQNQVKISTEDKKNLILIKSCHHKCLEQNNMHSFKISGWYSTSSILRQK